MTSTSRLGWLVALSLATSACSDTPTAAGSGVDDDTGTSGGDAATDADEAGDPDASGGVLPICVPGTTVCGAGELLTCTPDGGAWNGIPCAAGEQCVDGGCTASPLAVVTEVLPPATLGFAYEQTLLAAGGVPPYAWQVGVAEPPPGLTLDATGTLSGVPETPGDYVFEAVVSDGAATSVAREFSLSVHPEPLTIITLPDLGAFDEGTPMHAPLLALGGVPPYGWFLVDGALPQGTFIDAAGAVSGVPLEPGPFDFRLRVVDAQSPSGADEQDFSLQIDLRPLSIVGDQSYDLLAFEVIVLPLLTIVPGIPVPYSTQLQADGGLQPYQWSEQPLPGGLSGIIPQAGIPADLVLDADGTLSGSVTDTDQVITVPLLLAGIDLTGFFFYAEVADSQSPAETDQALFVIPTLPVGG